MRSFFQGLVRGFGFTLVVVILPMLVMGLIVRSVFSIDSEVRNSYPSKTEAAVAVVELKGEIVSIDRFRRALQDAVEAPNVKAIALRIDSPGGGTGTSEEMYHLVRAADEKKPVVCSLGSIAASGGLYAAQGCRKIVALKGTMTGSIGVIVMLPMVEEVMQRIGVDMNVLKSGEFKDVGSPFREMNERDRELLKRLIDQNYEQFIDVISEERGIPKEEVRRFADGRIILGEEALKLKLVDEIGGIERAAELALQATGSAETPEVLYPRERSGIERFLGAEAVTFLNRFLRSDRPQVLFKMFF